MIMLEIVALDNGAHRNQTYHGNLPDGWVVDKNNLCVENFPFGEVVAEEIDGVMTVTGWTPGAIPEPEVIEPTPSEKREQAYNIDKIISWNNEMITVTEASQLWQYYAAEGSEKATELQTLIAEAKVKIREQYPDA